MLSALSVFNSASLDILASGRSKLVRVPESGSCPREVPELPTIAVRARRMLRTQLLMTQR